MIYYLITIKKKIKIPDNELDIKIIKSAVGDVTKGDIQQAKSLNALLLGFNVKIQKNAEELMKKLSLNVHIFEVVYDLIDFVCVFIYYYY